MKGLKKKFRRGLAGFLSFVLTMTSFNMVSWADVASAFEKENATFVMSGEDLRDSAQAAIDNGDEFNFEDLGVDTSDRSLAKEYQRLFETGSVFEFAPAYDMDEEEYADGAELRMFIRINGDPEGYQITGDEDIIFLYINDSSARVTFRSRIDGYTTQKVTVKGNSTLLEAAGPTVPSDGAGAAGGAGAGTNGAAGGEVQNPNENAGGENGTVEGNVQNPDSDAADGSVQNPDANAGEGNGTTDGTVENPDAGVNDGTDNGTTGSDIQNPAGNADEGNGTAGETAGNPEINGNNGSGTAGSDIQNPDANADSDKNANTGKDEQIQNPADHSGSSDNGQNSENGKTEEGQKSEAGADKQSSNDDKGGSNASSDEGNAGSGASDSGSSDSGSSDSGASSSGDAVVSAASVIRNYTHILTTSVNNEAGSDEKASSDEKNEEKEVVSADSGDSKEKADAGEKKDAEEVKADSEDSNSSDSDNKEAAAAPADDVESNTVDDGDKADSVIPADREGQNPSDDQADGQGEVTAPADNQDNAVIDDNVKDDADKNAAADSKADDTNVAGNDHGVNADGGKNDNTPAVEPEDEEEKEVVSKTGTTSGKTYGQIVLDESYYAKAYVTTLNKLHVDVSKEGYAVTYTVTPVGTAAVKGAKNVEAGKDLTFTVKPQVGYVIDSVTANGESLDAVEEDDATDSNAETGVKRFVVPEVEEEQEIVVAMAETGEHPEFNFSKTLGDVVVSLHAEEGILPAGTVAKVTEVTEKVEEAVKEKKEHEENTEVSAVLAYDIKLFHDGEELDNSWSDNGYVEVTFSGTDIEKKSAVADSVEVLHVDTGEVDTTDADIDKIAVEEVQSLETVAETVNVEGNDAVGEISFEAEHFSVYTLTFIKNKTEYELIVNSRAFSGYRPVENFNYENKVSVDANRDIIPVAELAEETITVDNKNYHFSKATAENNYESANVNGITCDSAGVLSGVGTDGKKIELADNNIYIWYVPVGEEIPVVFYYMDKSGHVRSQHDGIIPAGMIAENAPEVDGYRFKEAKVSGIGAGTVNYITKDGDTVYYSDDTIGSDVSYALVDNQKIELYYIEKFEEFKITYLVSGDDKNSKNEYDGPTIVEKGENLIFQVKVAAGYDVSISIGNKIINPETTALSDRVRTYKYGPINSDTTVNIKYSKINQFLFDTEYIRTHNNAASGYFHNATYSPHSNEKAGGYSGKKTYIQNNGHLTFTMTTASDIYWQMNGFQVNDVDIAVPAEYKVGAESSQTLYDEAGNAIVNININLVSINGRSYSYTVTFSNVLTDITITGGNFRAKDHSEVMPIDISEGVIAEYRYKVAGKYPWNPAEWTTWPGTAVKGSSPIGFEGTDDVIGFRYKAKPGYTEPTVVVDKGTVSKITSSGEYKEFAITKTYESLPATLSITNQPIIYTVKYHENGGISGTAPTDSSRYSIEDNHSIYVSTKIPGNEDSQQVFQGWALTADATEPIVGTNQEIELADILSKAPKTGNEINLYAVWTINPAAKYANYKIEIYREGDNGYSHFVTEYGRGLADTSLRLKTSNYENKYEEDGYYLNLSAPDTKVTIEKLSRENDSNQNVFRLYYDLKRYTITTRVENGSILYNGGDVSNSQVSAKYGMDAAFDYSGLDDYKLVKIEIDGKVLSAEEMKANADSYTFYNVRKNHSITVKYEQWYQVTYDKGMAEGTVPVDSKKYEKGAEVTVLPNIGLTLETESELTTSFIAWTPDLDSEVKTLYYPGDHFEIVKDTVLYPVFAGDGSEYRTITFAAGDNGSLEKAGTTSSSFAYPIGAGDVFEKVITGESFIPVPSPNTDYKFSKWSVEGENIQYASAKELFEAYAESPVDDDLVFTAEFVSMKDAGYEFWFNGVGLGDALDNLGTYVKSSSQWIINTAWNAAGFDGDSLPLNTIKEVEERANEVRNLYVQETGKTNLVYKYFTVDQENDSGSWDSIFDSTQNTDNDFKTLKLRSNHMTRYHIVFEASMEVTATAQELTYDGTAQNLLKNVAVTVKETGEVIEEPELTFRVAKYADGVLGDYERLDTPTGVEAGKYSVEIRASKEGYTDVKTWVDVTIKKRILKFKTLYKEKDYDGKPLTNPVFAITEGDAAPNQELQVYVNGSITNVGKIKNTVSSHRVVASGTDVSDKNAKDYKDNYEISYFEEDLVVKAAKGNRVTVEGQTVMYDGTAYGLKSATAEKEGSILQYSTDGTKYSETAPTFTEAGTYTVYVIAKNLNYVDTDVVKADVVINPRKVSIQVNNADKEYGEDDPKFTGNFEELVNSGAIVKAGDLGEITYERAEGDKEKNDTDDKISLTAKYKMNPNYDVSIVTGTLTIRKRPVTIIAESASKKYDGTALTKNSAYVSETTELLKGHTLKSVTVSGSQTDPGETDNIPSGAVIKAGDEDVTKNYDISYVNGTLTVSNGEIKIRVKAASDRKVYDGTPLSNAGVKLEAGELAKGDTLSGTAEGSITDRGTEANLIESIKITSESGKDVTDSYIIEKEPGTLEITARLLEITAGSGKRAYDGTPLTNSSAEITGGSLAEGQKLESVRVEGSLTLPGTEKNTASHAVIKAGSEDVSANYEVTYQEGTLEITRASIALKVTAPDAEKKYDGEALTSEVCTIGANLAEGDRVYVNAAGSATNVTDSRKGNNPVGEVKVLHDGTYDVTENYKIETTAGTLTITPREVTLTSGGGKKAYDGSPLTNGTVTEGGDGFVKEEGAVYTVTGSQLEKGSSRNSFSYDLKDNTKKENYTITKEEGMLEVTASETPIIITARDAEKVYDGTELTEAGYSYTEGVLAAGDELKAVVEGSQTEAGSTANVVTGYQVLHDGKDVTSSYTFGASVPGTLTVKQRKATIKVNTYTKVYGTADPVFDGVVVGLVHDDDLGKIIFARTQTDIDKENVNDTINLTASYTPNNNYEVTIENGVLTIINSSENAVNAIGQSVIYDGREYGLKAANSLQPGSTLLYSTDNVTFNENSPVFTEAGTYTVYVKATNPNYNETQVAEGTVVISKREITITADSAEKRYDGTDLTAPTATITGGTLAEGQTLESVTVTGAQRSTGTSANVASNAMIKSGNTDVTANYAITYTDGVLTVTSVGGNSGGNPGGNGGGSTPNENKPYQPGGPGDNNGPTVTIDPDAVPLANAPVDGSPTDNLILIDDGNVPLAGLPKTGDRAGAQAGLAAILSGFLLAAFSMLNNKKKEENK